MIFVYKDRIIQIEWSIFRGTSQVPEDFSRALVKLFLVGNYEKYAVPVTAEGGTLVAQMPQDLPDGAYSLEAIWVKNYNNLFPVRGTDTPSVGSRNIRYPGPCHNDYGMTHPWDHRSNDRCLMRSRKEYVFAVTSYPGEETAVNQDGYVTIKISSAVATYGYDGLSAYEIAVMRGDFNGTEKDFLAKNIINNPDNEDLTIAKEGGYDVIKFADKEYNALNHSGLGRVYLRKNIVSSINKNILTQDMIKKTNTRYIIQYDYDLNGEEITIPEGCTLDFQEGSFSNGVIYGKINIISGNRKIFNNITIIGGLVNNLNLYWIGASENVDIGAIINESEKYSSNLYLPPGTYTMNTPCTITGKGINFEGGIIYTGNKGTTAITLKNVIAKDIFIARLYGDDNPNIDYSIGYNDENKNKIIGLNFINCMRCNITILSLIGFNEGARFSGIGSGCTSNNIRIKLSYYNNIGIRFYQKDDEDGNIGWTNQNYVYQSSFAVMSSWNNVYKTVGIYIKGSENGDNYNHINNLSFQDINLEGYKQVGGYPVIAYNLEYSKFYACRNENNLTFLKVIGKCRDIEVNLGYSNSDTIDFSECTYGDPLTTYYKPLYELKYSDCIKASNTNYLISRKFNFSSREQTELRTYGYNSGNYFTVNKPAITINANGCLKFLITSSQKCRVYIMYHTDTSDNDITFDNLSDYDPPKGAAVTFTLNDTEHRYTVAVDITSLTFTIPDNIKTFDISFSRTFEDIRIYYSGNKTPEIKLIKIEDSGTTNDRPTIKEEGRTYYDTDLKKMILWNGSAWVNMDGTALE